MNAERVILNFVIFILISNKPIKFAHLQKLANQSMVNGSLTIEMVTILLVKARKTLVVWWSEEHANRKKKKNEIEIWTVKILFPLDFAIYLSCSEVQKSRKVDNV